MNNISYLAFLFISLYIMYFHCDISLISTEVSIFENQNFRNISINIKFYIGKRY